MIYSKHRVPIHTKAKRRSDEDQGSDEDPIKIRTDFFDEAVHVHLTSHPYPSIYLLYNMLLL